MAFLGYDLTKAKIHCLVYEGNGFSALSVCCNHIFGNADVEVGATDVAFVKMTDVLLPYRADRHEFHSFPTSFQIMNDAVAAIGVIVAVEVYHQKILML